MKTGFYLLYLLICFCLLTPLAAQEATPEATPAPLGFTPLSLGENYDATLDQQTFQKIYGFEGLRGEILNFQIEVQSGDLFPMLLVFDSMGNLLLEAFPQDGLIEQSLKLSKGDLYRIIIARFGYELGTTSGSYRFHLDRTGVLSEQGSTLRYGDSVFNTINHSQTQVYYTFQAAAGDIVNVEMIRSSGNLDPYLQIVDGAANVLADNDDIPGSGNHNARIESFLIENAGTYIIIGSRYGQTAGDSVGSFVLTLDEASHSGLGNSTLAPFPLKANQFVQADINDEQYERFYTIQLKKDDIITITMDRVGGTIDAYLIFANAALQTILENDDGGGGQNARIDKFRIPEDGLYYILATRFDGKEGTTAGEYKLQITSVGNAFATVPDFIPRLSYGTTVTGNISEAIPELTFAFYGNAGEEVTISMTRSDGDLDPYVELLDNGQRRLAYDDDSGDEKNARILRYRLPYTGIFYIRALRFSGEEGNNRSAGTFILVLAQLVD